MLRWSLGAALVFATLLPAARPVADDGDEPDGSALSERGRAYVSRRVVRVFDFEERDEGNFERLPRDWFVLGGPGFPRYTSDLTGFDTQHARSARHSLKLQLNGGSSGIRLQPGAVAAVPGADYLVVVHLHTEGLKHSRARVVAHFVDEHGRTIEPSVTRSPLLEADAGWRRVEVRLDGDFDHAAWIVLRLELLQSRAFRPPILGPHEVYRSDFDAKAWFDDLVIYQLPRIELSTASPTNILRQPADPTLHLTVRDLTGDPLQVVTRVYDHRGRVVDTQQRRMNGRQPSDWQWTPRLPGFGWYWADLRVRGPRGLEGRRSAALLYLPAANARAVPEAHRFGLAAELMPAPHRALLPELMERLKLGAIITDLWRADLTAERMHELESTLDAVLARLIDQGHQVTVSLAEVPEPIARTANVDTDRPWLLFAGDEQQWQPMLEGALVRYGQQIRRWQIGRTGTGEAFWRDDLPALHQQLRQAFARLVPDATVVVPWQANQEMGPATDAIEAFTLYVPQAVPPARFADYADTWPRMRQRLGLVLETLPPDRFDHAQRAQDLVHRLVRAWAEQPAAIYLDRPWTAAPGRRPALLPDPLLGVYVNTVQRLAGRRFVGSTRLAPGVPALILEGPDGGALVAWNQTHPDDQVAAELYLGPHPQIVDIWGNHQPLPTRDGRHRVHIGRMPTFIEGVNPRLARFRAGLELDPGFLESSYKVHETKLVMTNPWPTAVSGRLRLTGLDDWRIQPRVFNFDIPAGQRIEIPLEVSFPASELAGEKTLGAEIDLDADQPYYIRAGVAAEVGLPGVDYHGTLLVDGADVLLVAQITNRGDQPQSFYAFAMAPQHPRQERIVAKLAPGQTLMKRFRFAGAADALAGRSIRAGLRQMDGPAMLNHRYDVP